MPNAILHADLGYLNLGSLLQLSEAEFISGHIIVDNAGQIDLAGGQTVGAKTEAGLSGRQAVYELFLETTGAARIELNPKVAGAVIAPTISLVMEGCRLLDEWSEIAERRLMLDRDVQASSDDEATALSTIAALMPHLARAPIGEAARAASMARTMIVSPIRTLISAGILTEAVNGHAWSIGPPPLPSEVRVDESDVDPSELLVRGREAFREGELQLAEQLWVRALSQLPNDRVLAQNLRVVRQRIAASG